MLGDLKCSGKLFQSLSALIENAHLPQVSVKYRGTARETPLLEFEQSVLVCSLTSSKSQRYDSARPFSTLQVRSNVLKIICFFTGSQCRSNNGSDTIIFFKGNLYCIVQKLNILQCTIVIVTLDVTLQPKKQRCFAIKQGPVVHRLERAIQWINTTKSY